MPSRPSFRLRASQPQLIRFRRRAFFEPLEDRRMMAIADLLQNLQNFADELQDQIDDTPITDASSYAEFEAKFKAGFTDLVVQDVVEFFNQNNPVPETVSEFMTTDIFGGGAVGQILDVVETLNLPGVGNDIPRTPKDLIITYGDVVSPDLSEAMKSLDFFLTLPSIEQQVNDLLSSATATAGEFDDLFNEIKTEFDDLALPIIDQYNQLEAAANNVAELADLANDVITFLDTLQAIPGVFDANLFTFEFSENFTGDDAVELFATPRFPMPGLGVSVGFADAGITLGAAILGTLRYEIVGGINLTDGLALTTSEVAVGINLKGDGSAGINIGGFEIDAAELSATLVGEVGARIVDGTGDSKITVADFSSSCYFQTFGGISFRADVEYPDPNPVNQVVSFISSGGPKTKSANLVNEVLWNAESESCDPLVNGQANVGAITDGILLVEGTDDPDTVTVTLDTSDPDNPLIVVEKTTGENTFTREYDPAAIQEIHILTLGGDDTVNVSQRVTIPTLIDGGDDNDTLNGGGGPDQVLGGAGIDTIRPGMGDDFVQGGEGDDEIHSSAGADVLHGDGGVDRFYVIPDLRWSIEVVGGSPGVGDDGVPPGDILALDLTGVSGAQVPRNVRSGAVGSLSHGTLFFGEIETVVASDRFEVNDEREIATDLGSEPLTVLRDLSIHGEFDVDYFTFTAHQTGHATIEARFRHVIGDVDLYVYDSAGNLILDRLSTDDNELAVMPVVAGEQYFVRVTGFSDAVNNYTLEIVNFVVPVPSQVDLQWASDTGRHDSDDLTSDTTTTFDIYLDDSVLVGLGLIRDDDFDVQVFNNGVLLGEATHISNQRWVFTTATGDLEPGSDNFISAAVLVRDLADAQATGRGELSTSLQVTLDTVDPTVTFGLLGSTIDGLEGTSDTGVATQALTLSDRITSDAMPTFYGRADANAHIRLLLVTDDNGTADPSDDAVVELGAGLATLADGNGAYPDGNWSITSSIDLNAVSLGLPLDGPRLLRVVAEDAAGNVSDVDDLRIVLDTQGPRIASVLRVDGANVFEPTPLNPTPLVHAIDVTFFDRRPPGTVHAAANLALLTNPASYRVVGDANGQVLVATAVVQSQGAVTIDGIAGTAVTVRLTFSAPLPDDRLTVTVLDVIQDDAGNALDGESHAASPGGASGQLPSGDGAVGGSFVGRFTVDSRPEFGVWAGGSVYVDTNGNFNYDPENADDTNEDITYHFGLASDLLLSGNFSATAAATADGFDKLAAYGRVGTRYRWLVDTDNDGVADLSVIQDVPPGATSVAGVPVAGNFDGDATNGDEVGLKVGNVWWLDTNHDFKVDTRLAGSNMVGLPIVGDFDGDGVDDLGAWADDTFSLNLSLAGPIDGAVDRTFAFGFPGVGERPIAGDFDGDTITDIGLWVPERSGPGSAGEWFVLVSAGRTIQQRMAGGIAFSPSPLGSDLFGQFGNSFGIPLFGNFDPPLTPPSGDNPGTDIRNNLDTNSDGYVTPLDALIVINALNLSAAAGQEPSGDVDPLLDTNGDSAITPLDALIVINWLNAELTPSGGSGEEAAEGEALDVDLGGAAELDDDLLLALALDGAEAKKRR